MNEEPLKLYVHYCDLVDSRTDYGNIAYFILGYPSSSSKDDYIFIKPDGTSIKFNKYRYNKVIHNTLIPNFLALLPASNSKTFTVASKASYFFNFKYFANELASLA